MSAEIQGLSNGNAALVVERGLSLAAKPSAVMAVMCGPTPAARTLYRFGSTTVWLIEAKILHYQFFPQKPSLACWSSVGSRIIVYASKDCF